MIRLVFDAPRAALGARRRRRASSRGGQKLVVARDVGDYQLKVEDGPWPAFPADLTSIAVALATQAEGSVLIHEKMFENRLFFVDKLISMGAEHHPLRPAPGDRHRARAGCAASASSRPDIRAGMAMLIAALCADGRLGDRQHPARSTAATSASTSACASWARASSASRPSRSTPSRARGCA